MSDDRGARELERRLSEFILSSMGKEISDMVADQLAKATEHLKPPPGTATEDHVAQQVGSLRTSLSSIMNQQLMEQDNRLRRQEEALRLQTVQLRAQSAQIKKQNDDLHELEKALRELGGTVKLKKSQQLQEEVVEEEDGEPRDGFWNLGLPKFDNWVWITLIGVLITLLAIAAFLVKSASEANAERKEAAKAVPVAPATDTAPGPREDSMTLGAAKVRTKLPDGKLAALCPEEKRCDFGQEYDDLTEASRVYLMQEIVITLDEVGNCPGDPRWDGRLKSAEDDLKYQSSCLKKLGVDEPPAALMPSDLRSMSVQMLMVLGQ